MFFRFLLLPAMMLAFGQSVLASNYYMGLNFGAVSQDAKIYVEDNSLDPIIPNVSVPKDYVAPDESVSAGSFFVGYRLSQDMAIEFGGVGLDTATSYLHVIDNGDPNVEFGGYEESELSFTYLTLVGVWPMGNNLSLTGKFGLASWDFKFKQWNGEIVQSGNISLLDQASISTDSYSDSGSDFYYGFGASYGFNRHFDIRAELTYLPFKPDFVNVGMEQTMTMFFIGAAFHF